MSTRFLLGVACLTGVIISLGQIVGAGTGGAPAAAGPTTANGSAAEFIATGAGPDVIVGSLPAIVHWASDGTETAYSFGTTSCNIGDADLDWIQDPSNLHPVIGQNMFRLSADGRFEQVGQAWLKHGFCALQNDLAGCGSCPNTPGCLDHLEPGCSDPYSASRNGGQGGMGPKWQVNAHTGVFPMPWDNGEGTSGSFRRRLRVKNVDLEPALNPGALYFIEGQYVTQDDSAAGNQNNNASYRRATVSASFDVTLEGSTEMTRPGIQAWQDFDPSVTLVDAQVPNEGLFIVGYAVTDNGDGTYGYEYAIYNMNSDRSAGGFSIPVGDGAGLTSVGFHDVDYHSGEAWDSTDWSWSVVGGDLTWETEAYADNVNANALRWGTLYNFRFTSDREPVPATARIDLFKPGSPASLDVVVLGPDPSEPLIAFDFPDGLPGLIDPAGDTVRVEIAELVPGSLVPGSGTIHVDAGGGYIASVLTPLGGDLYEGSFGASVCGTVVSYYFSADTTDGGSRTSPVGAPGVSYSTTSAVAIVTSFDDDGETDPGWTVENVDLTDGAWDRGVPAGGGDRGDPAADYDGSGQCWLTDNVDGNSDVDGGPTRLISPAFDLSGASIADITYARWFTNDDQDADRLDVHLSDDDGATWVLVESVPDTAGWQVVTARVDDYVALTSQVRIRFSATDNPSNSVTEAAVDAVRVDAVFCTPPGASGACCFDDGSCTFVTASSCTTSGGSYQGDDVTCAAAACLQPGACCFGDGSCTFVFASDCVASGGTPQGDNVSCAAAACAQPGACCFGDGSCTFVFAADCTASGGDPQGDNVTCAAANCPQPPVPGACCFGDGSCTFVLAADCTASGGTPQGDNVSCGAAACAQPGACCFDDGSCTYVFAAICTASGGDPQGDNVSCGAAACAQPGACCFDDGSCTFVFAADCTASGGDPQGDGVTCAAAACAQPGACCFDDGSCTFVLSAACAAAGGAPQGDGIDCAAASCAQPGACCFGDGACTFVFASDCAAAGGTPQGDDVTCAAAACAQPGACCFDDGSCTFELAEDCTAAGGSPQGDGVACAGVECTIPCPQDIDGDTIIGFLDLLEVLSNWGPCVGCPHDLDGDGLVGFLDLLDVLSNWGPCP